MLVSRLYHDRCRTPWSQRATLAHSQCTFCDDLYREGDTYSCSQQQNRKLRHLQAVTLRNLALSQESIRPRRGTIDDEGLPTTKKSPAKLLAMRDAHIMTHSKSSDDLRPIHESAITVSSSPNKQRTPPRPSMAKLRRRSTLEWAAATSQQRQKRLEHVSAARMADLFYSLHIDSQQGRSVCPSQPV